MGEIRKAHSIKQELKPYLLCSFFILCFASGCSGDIKQKNACNSKKHEVYLGVTNDSFIDTLAHATVLIDDSLVFNQPLRLHRSSSTTFQKILRLCDGPHRVNAQFGRYKRDTILVIREKTSLIVAMDYETAYTHNNGLVIVTLARDGSPAID